MKRQSIEPSEAYATSIGPAVHLRGKLRSSLPLDLRCALQGSTIEGSFVRIAQGAAVEATECSVARAAILGRFSGSMSASESIVILPKANVRAHIKAPRIEIIEGALFEGEIDVIDNSDAH